MMVFSAACFKADNVEAYGEGSETMIVRAHYLGSKQGMDGTQAIIDYEAALFESMLEEPRWYRCYSDAETAQFEQDMEQKGYALSDPIWYPVRETIKPYRRR